MDLSKLSDEELAAEIQRLKGAQARSVAPREDLSKLSDEELSARIEALKSRAEAKPRAPLDAASDLLLKAVREGPVETTREYWEPPVSGAMDVYGGFTNAQRMADEVRRQYSRKMAVGRELAPPWEQADQALGEQYAAPALAIPRALGRIEFGRRGERFEELKSRRYGKD